MVTRERTEAGHTLRFTITQGEGGWHVRETRDSEVVRAVTYTDWHRVERAMAVFEIGLSASARQN